MLDVAKQRKKEKQAVYLYVQLWFIHQRFEKFDEYYEKDIYQ